MHKRYMFFGSYSGPCALHHAMCFLLHICVWTVNFTSPMKGPEAENSSVMIPPPSSVTPSLTVWQVIFRHSCGSENVNSLPFSACVSVDFPGIDRWLVLGCVKNYVAPH